MEKRYAKWIKERQLLRVQLTRNGRKRIMSVRLLLFEAEKQQMLLYNEDEKQVYNLYIKEIDKLEEV